MQIGTQCWLGENLNSDDNTQGTSSWYNDDATNGATYGRLYNWDAAIDIDSKIDGWHLPTDAEWDTLAMSLGGIKDDNGDYPEVGGKMKVGGGSGFNAMLVPCLRATILATSTVSVPTVYFGRRRVSVVVITLGVVASMQSPPISPEPAPPRAVGIRCGCSRIKIV